MPRAVYSLKKHVASFNFFHWLILARAAGATEIVFDTATIKVSKWPFEIMKRRIDSILLPGSALAGLPFRVNAAGMTPTEIKVEKDFGPFVAWCRTLAGKGWPRLRAPFAAARPVDYTVTLRRTTRTSERNSREADWRRFAADIGALVIEDFDDRPIGLHERVALYEGARMNFFVTNGPGFLCSLTAAPCMIFGCSEVEGLMRKNGIAPGEQLPWAGRNQFLVWKPDRLCDISETFESWLRGQETWCGAAAIPSGIPTGS